MSQWGSGSVGVEGTSPEENTTMGERPEDELPEADDQAPRRPRPRPRPQAAARPAAGQRSARPSPSHHRERQEHRRAAPARRARTPARSTAAARRGLVARPSPAQPSPARPTRPPGPAQIPAQRRRQAARPTRSPATRPPGRRPPPSTRPAKSQTTMIIVLSGVSVVVVLLLIGAFLIPSGAGDPQSAQTSQTTDPTALGTTVPDAQLTSFKDDATGFSVKYPKAWTKVDSGDPTVPLILSFGTRDGVRVRLDYTEVPTNAQNIANIKAVTDGVVGQNKTAKLLQQRQVAVDNMPGYYYLYTFVDEAIGRRGRPRPLLPLPGPQDVFSRAAGAAVGGVLRAGPGVRPGHREHQDDARPARVHAPGIDDAPLDAGWLIENQRPGSSPAGQRPGGPKLSRPCGTSRRGGNSLGPPTTAHQIAFRGPGCSSAPPAPHRYARRAGARGRPHPAAPHDREQDGRTAEARGIAPGLDFLIVSRPRRVG